MISEAGQDAQATARREAYEELGVRLASMDLVSRVWSSPGVSSERVSLFLARYVAADRIAAGGGVRGEHEGITVVERSLSTLAAAADEVSVVGPLHFSRRIPRVGSGLPAITGLITGMVREATDPSSSTR